MKSVLILSCFLGLAGLQAVARQQGPGAQARSNQEAERAIVAQTISSVIGWAKNKDLDLFYCVLDDINTHKGEPALEIPSRQAGTKPQRT